MRIALTLHGLIASGFFFTSSAMALECGDVLGPRGHFVLDKNLACTTTTNSPALTLLSGAVLDMKDHSITCLGEGVLTYGVRLDGRKASVRNGRVTSCDIGVHVAGDGGHVVSNMYLSVATSNSVSVDSDGNQVLDTVVTEGDWAFAIAGDRNLLARNRSVHSSGDGFFVIGNANRLIDNVAVFSVCNNFSLVGTNNYLARNVASGTLLSACSAIEIGADAKRNTLERNVVTGSASNGVVSYGDSNRFLHNIITRNAAAGIELTNLASENFVRRNIVNGNGTFDLQDDSSSCNQNIWRNNHFESSSPTCIR